MGIVGLIFQSQDLWNASKINFGVAKECDDNEKMNRNENKKYQSSFHNKW